MRRMAVRLRGLVGVALFAAPLAATQALAQMTLPAAQPPSGAELFKRQCATCHAVNTTDAQRQGPSLAGIVGRKAGSLPGFHYSAGFAKAEWSWDEQHLDSWLTNPQAMIPGAVMPYRQAKADIRHSIIGYLKELQ